MMRTTETKESNSGIGRNFRRFSYAAVLAILGLGAAWFVTRHSWRTKGISHDPMSNMSAMGSSVSASSSEVPAVSDELQVELAADDLKKAQVRTVRVGEEATATKLRVPGIVRPNEYRDVHVTSLIGGIVKQVPVVL